MAHQSKHAAEDASRNEDALARALRRLSYTCTNTSVKTPLCVPTDDATGIAALPRALVRDVFKFLAPTHSTWILCDGLDSLRHENELAPLRGVCREWLDIAQAVWREGVFMNYNVVLLNDTPEEQATMPPRSKDEDKTVQYLSVRTTSIDIFGLLPVNSRFPLETFDQAWWNTLLHNFPNVVRLDLSLVPTELVAMALSSASRLCPQVRSLELRCGPARVDDNEDRFSEMTTALWDALARWYDSNGGLRVLTVPHWVARREANYARFFEAVTAFCPNIEYLRDTSLSQAGTNSIFGPHQWPDLAIDVWAAFCQKCTRLREFSWAIVPFSSQHVKLFNAVPRPYLEALRLCTFRGDWWHDVKNLTPVMEMVDNITTLRWFQFTLGGRPSETTFPPEAMNELARHVAANCPHLETCVMTDTVCDVKSVAISAEAVEALARIHTMNDLELPSATVGDQTLVAILQCLAGSKERNATVTIGADNNIDTAVCQVLEFLAQQPADGFAVSLQLSVRSLCRVGESGAYVMPESGKMLQPDALEELVEAAKLKHSKTLSYIHVVVESRIVGGEKLQSIRDFDLFLNVDRSVVTLFLRDLAFENGVFGALEAGEHGATDLVGDEEAGAEDEFAGDREEDLDLIGDEGLVGGEDYYNAYDDGSRGGVVFEKERRSLFISLLDPTAMPMPPPQPMEETVQ